MCGLMYQFYLDYVSKLPRIPYKFILEHSTLSFIIIRLLALEGGYDYQNNKKIIGYDDAIQICRFEFNDDQCKAFNEAWKKLQDFRDTILAHIDAGQRRYSEGINERLSIEYLKEINGMDKFIIMI